MNLKTIFSTAVFTAVFLFVSVQNVIAQDSITVIESIKPIPLKPNYDASLQEIRITEKRLNGQSISAVGRNVQIITSEDLKKMPVQTVSEALTYIAGVDLRQRGVMGGQGDLSIQGSTFEQVLVLVNGIPMRDPQTGHHQMNLPFDISAIERIEVLKGSASRIYGANAMAGAINIITKNPGQDGRVYVSTFAGSNFETDTASGDMYYQSGIRAGVGIRRPKSGHQVDVSYLNTNGYRYNSQNEQSRVNYLGRIQALKGTINLMAGALFNDFGANSFYAPPYDVNSVEKVTTTFGGANYNYYKNQWHIYSNVYWRYNHDDYIFIKDNPSYYRNNHFGSSAGVELHASRQIANRHFVGGGYESRAELIRSNNLGKYERYYHSFYGEWRMYLNNSTSITAGANAQYNTDFGWKVYPGLELNAYIYRGLRFFFNTGLSNRLPSYTDLYYDGPSNIGNANLQPENAFNMEAGFKHSTKKITWQASGFVRDIDNFIDFVRDSVNADFQPRNFQHVQVRGADLSASYNFRESGQYEVAPTVARVSYTYLDATLLNDNLESKYALEHLRHQLSALVSVKTGAKLNHSFTFRYNERFKGQEYGVLDYRIAYNHNKWRITGDVTNILDREYKEVGFIPMPGRWFRIGVEFKLN
jgi:iron complex outermembrane receptor protein